MKNSIEMLKIFVFLAILSLTIGQDSEDIELKTYWSSRYSRDFSKSEFDGYAFSESDWIRTNRGLELGLNVSNTLITGPTYTGDKEIDLCFQLLFRPTANSSVQEGFLGPGATTLTVYRGETTYDIRTIYARSSGLLRLTSTFTYAINVTRELPNTDLRSYLIDSIFVDIDCGTWKEGWRPIDDDSRNSGSGLSSLLVLPSVFLFYLVSCF